MATFAAVADRVRADWVDTFPGGVPQQTWLTASLPGFSQFTQSYFPGGQQLSSNVEVFDGGAQIAYAYVNEFFDGSLGVRVRSVINPSPQVPAMTHTGVLAYLNPFTTSAYAVGVTWTSPAAGAPQRVIEINRSSFGGIQFQGGRAIPGFNPNLSYIIEAEVSPINELGNQVVTARLYDMQETLVTEYSDVFRQNPPPDDPTAASPLTAGRSGVFTWRSDSGSDVALLGRWGTTSSSLPSPDLVWGGTTNLTIPHNDGFIPQGGSGTWAASQANWLYANAPTYWNSARKAIFRGTPGTVTVETPGATAAGGLDFRGNGFIVRGGAVTLGGTAGNSISVATGVSTRIESPLAGTAGLRKVGAGTLVLAGTSTLTGSSSVQDGQLTVDGALAGSHVSVTGGVLGGTGSVGGLTVAAGGSVSPGASPGTLTVTGNATLGAGGNYNWQILNATGTAGSTTGWDLLSVGGVLDVAATAANPFRLNLWSLSGVSPDVNGNAINWSATTSGTWRIASAAGGITNFSADKFLINVSATNGTGGFTNPLAGGTFSLARSGNNLNLVFTSAAPPVITINVASGTQTQGQAGRPLLTGTTPVQKTGAGTVVFDQANTLTGPTTVSQGTLVLGNAAALSSSPVTVAAGAKLSVGPQVAAVVPALVNNGLVDVGLGSLTITAGQGQATLVAAIVAGRNDGTWDGTTGITSSAAAAQSERAVGWLDNGDGSFTVGYAAAGDWNVNGIVDFDDVVQFVSAGLFDTGLPATWAEGDYDYNGVVDFDDVLAQSAAGLFDAGPYNVGPGGILPLGGGVAAVPEPATWVLVAVGAACAACRRRFIRSS